MTVKCQVVLSAAPSSSRVYDAVMRERKEGRSMVKSSKETKRSLRRWALIKPLIITDGDGSSLM